MLMAIKSMGVARVGMIAMGSSTLMVRLGMRYPCCIMHGVGVELRITAGRAEGVTLAFILSLVSGPGGIDHHATDRIMVDVTGRRFAVRLMMAMMAVRPSHLGGAFALLIVVGHSSPFTRRACLPVFVHSSIRWNSSSSLAISVPSSFFISSLRRKAGPGRSMPLPSRSGPIAARSVRIS